MMQCFPPVGANSLAALVLTHCLTASKQTHNGVTMTTSQWRFGGLGALLSSLAAGRCWWRVGVFSEWLGWEESWVSYS